MTFFSVVNSETVTVATDRCIIPAAQANSLSSALDTAARLSELHSQMDERVRAAEKKGYEAGLKKGLAKGEAAAARTLSEQVLTMERNAERERAALRERALDNALGIVRRIASSLGKGETLAALALQAAEEMMPSSVIVVQVHPDQIESVRARLAARRQQTQSNPSDSHDALVIQQSGVDLTLLVEAESSLDASQCRLRSTSGTVVLAGLETQLRRIERHAISAKLVGSPVVSETMAEGTSAVSSAPSEAASA